MNTIISNNNSQPYRIAHSGLYRSAGILLGIVVLTLMTALMQGEARAIDFGDTEYPGGAWAKYVCGVSGRDPHRSYAGLIVRTTWRVSGTSTVHDAYGGTAKIRVKTLSPFYTAPGGVRSSYSGVLRGRYLSYDFGMLSDNDCPSVSGSGFIISGQTV